MDVGLEESNVY